MFWNKKKVEPKIEPKDFPMNAEYGMFSDKEAALNYFVWRSPGDKEAYPHIMDAKDQALWVRETNYHPCRAGMTSFKTPQELLKDMSNVMILNQGTHVRIVIKVHKDDIQSFVSALKGIG